MSKYPKDICGIDADSPELRKVLRNWMHLMLIGSDWPVDDAPWWYNERASVSQLAGAVWRASARPAWALEEYAITRGDRLDQRKRRGRCDLMFEVGGLRVIAEAKQLFVATTKSGDCGPTLRHQLKNAKNQVIKAPNPQNQYQRHAMVFVVPFVARSLNADISALNKRIQEVTQSVESELKTQASFAWAFPASRRQNLESPRFRNTFYPGCILAIEPV